MTAKQHTQKYLVVSFLIDLMPAFFFATYQLFLLERGLDLLQINLINVAYMSANFLLEIPTGAFADLWGRKRSTQIGIIFLGLSFLTYFLAHSFWFYVLAEIIGALGSTCISGALEAWFIDGKKVFGEYEHQGVTFAKEQQWRQVAVITGSVIGAQIGHFSLALPWLMAFLVSVIVLVIVSVLMHEDCNETQVKIGLSFQPIIKTAKDSVAYGLKNPAVMKLIGLGFVLSLAMMGINMQWPILFKSFGWDVRQLGWLFALIAITNSLGGRLAPHFKKRHSQEIHALIFSQVITAIGVIGAGLLLGPRITLAFFLMHQAGRGMFAPLKQDLLNKAIEHDNRATILSFSSMISNSGSVIGLLASGLIAKSYGIGSSWLFSGAILVLGFSLMLFHHHKNPTP